MSPNLSVGGNTEATKPDITDVPVQKIVGCGKYLGSGHRQVQAVVLAQREMEKRRSPFRLTPAINLTLVPCLARTGVNTPGTMFHYVTIRVRSPRLVH